MVCCICWIKAGRLLAFTLDLNTIQMSEATVTATGKKESGGSSAGHNNATISSRKESILELTKMMDAEVRVKCLGGRELQGILRGFDDLVNLVLDDCIEYIRGMYDKTKYLHALG
jgi:small nuclear ribonucleoprotein (snRNP)-like protein